MRPLRMRCRLAETNGWRTGTQCSARTLSHNSTFIGGGRRAAAVDVSQSISAAPSRRSKHVNRPRLHGIDYHGLAIGQPVSISTRSMRDGPPYSKSNLAVSKAQATTAVKAPNHFHPTESWTFQQYLYQSQVTQPATSETRVADNPEHKDDFTLWLDLLRFQERINGHAGIWMIFQGMRSRRIDLPVEGPEAEHFWKPIISAAIELDKVGEAWEYAQDLYRRSIQRYDGLYDILVGHYLRQGSTSHFLLKGYRSFGLLPAEQASDFELAYLWHSKLRTIDLPPPGAIKRLLPLLGSDASHETFMKIYLDCGERDLYDSIVPLLYKQHRHAYANKWRSFLLKNGDAPMVVNRTDSPRAVALFSTLTDKSRYETVNFYPQSLGRSKPEMRGPTRTENYQQTKRLSDEFCARAFATRAFNPSLVIKGLAAFGLNSIGPLALQALALRCRALVDFYASGSSDSYLAVAEELAVQLDNLNNTGIHIRECKYSLFVQKLVLERNGKILEATLTSDQHPDVYEDRLLQERLFESYIRSGDMTQAYKTLKLLTFDNSHAMWASWNVLLRACFRSPDDSKWSTISQLCEVMLVKKIPFSRSTIRDSLFTLLPHRPHGKVPVKDKTPVDSLSFVANLWIQVMRVDNNAIRPELWGELHRRFGLLKWFDSLENMILWTAARYSRKRSVASLMRWSTDKGIIRALPSRRNTQKSRLDRLFPASRQKEIVEWYFKSLIQLERRPQTVVGVKMETLLTTTSTLGHIEIWARGVAIIQKLKGFGLSVDTQTVRRECRQQLLNHFNEDWKFGVPYKTARGRNTRSLRYMVAYLQNLWLPVGSLFLIPKHILADESEEGERYLRGMILNQPFDMHQVYESLDFPLVDDRRNVRREDTLLPATLLSFEN